MVLKRKVGVYLEEEVNMATANTLGASKCQAQNLCQSKLSLLSESHRDDLPDTTDSSYTEKQNEKGATLKEDGGMKNRLKHLS